jgi:hypothetical protein
MNAGRCIVSALLAVLFLLAFAAPVLANVLAPTAYFWPGMIPMTVGLALPASVLAAFVERPFVSRAGIRQYAIWYSLQANFVSLAIGYITMPIGIWVLYMAGPLWSVIAIALSVVSEGWYYRWRALHGVPLRWGYLICGNLLSSVVLVVLPYIAIEINQARPMLIWEYESYFDSLLRWTLLGSLVMFALAFIAPTLLRRLLTATPKRLDSANHADLISADRVIVEGPPAE